MIFIYPISYSQSRVHHSPTQPHPFTSTPLVDPDFPNIRLFKFFDDYGSDTAECLSLMLKVLIVKSVSNYN